MSGFAQLIEWKSSRIDDVQKLNEEWRQRFPTSGPTRVVTCADRENEGSYLTFVEFASYEEAMKNNEDPATSEYAERMMALTDGPPTFHNLDIIQAENRT
jgi:hypothetical protein